jgi:hypothetical protein
MTSKTTLRHTGLVIAAVIALTSISTPGLAEDMRKQGTPEQREACTPDVMRLCMSSIYSVSAIMACLQNNKEKMSSRCRMALAWN